VQVRPGMRMIGRPSVSGICHSCDGLGTGVLRKNEAIRLT
jgi:hypothetical protein